ncbi:hypothetical protein ACFCVO_17330 [Agromyces sp. NPDC056379]|uniref:hypothetical protein n=1 Tax=unclassified Agromyces TaxID=2639701 RepID=UPI0035D6F60E
MTTHPTVPIHLWTEDAIVLFDWLNTVDLDAVPAEHQAVKQALTDLASRLEESVPYFADLTEERIARARDEVSKDTDW